MRPVQGVVMIEMQQWPAMRGRVVIVVNELSAVAVAIAGRDHGSYMVRRYNT